MKRNESVMNSGGRNQSYVDCAKTGSIRLFLLPNPNVDRAQKIIPISREILTSNDKSLINTYHNTYAVFVYVKEKGWTQSVAKVASVREDGSMFFETLTFSNNRQGYRQRSKLWPF